MSVQFHPEAEAEFLGAVDWYEERSAGLGGDFAAEIHAAIQRAVAMPLAAGRWKDSTGASKPVSLWRALRTARPVDSHPRRDAPAAAS